MQNNLQIAAILQVAETILCDRNRRLKCHCTYESRKLVVYVLGQLTFFFFKTASVVFWLFLEPAQQLRCQE